MGSGGGSGWTCYIGGATRPVITREGGKKYTKLFDSSQAGVTHPASCCFPSWWSVKALEGLVEAEWRGDRQVGGEG